MIPRQVAGPVCGQSSCFGIVFWDLHMISLSFCSFVVLRVQCSGLTVSFLLPVTPVSPDGNPIQRLVLLLATCQCFRRDQRADNSSWRRQ